MYTFSKSSRCEMKVWCSLTKGFNPLCIYRKSNLEYIYIANFCYKTHNFLFCRSSSTAGLIFGVLNSRATIFIFPHFIQIRLHRYFKCPTKPRLWWGRAFHIPLLINKPKINQKSWKFEPKEDVISLLTISKQFSRSKKDFSKHNVIQGTLNLRMIWNCKFTKTRHFFSTYRF